MRIDPRQQMEFGSAHLKNPALRLTAEVCKSATFSPGRIFKHASGQLRLLLAFLIVEVPSF